MFRVMNDQRVFSRDATERVGEGHNGQRYQKTLLGTFFCKRLLLLLGPEAAQQIGLKLELQWSVANCGEPQ